MEGNLNCLHLYLNDIKDYPVLEKEEEQLLGKNMKLASGLDIVIEGKVIKKLDLNKVFLLCVGDNNYKNIIDKLIKYYCIKESDKKTLNQLEKYKLISNNLNRALNKDELLFYLDISEEKIDIKEDLTSQIDKFLLYKYSFDKMYNCNLKLVVRIAMSLSRQYNRQVLIMDLINEGNIGLMRAVEKFDYEKDLKFSTYAYHWITQYATRVIINNEPVRIPDDLYLEVKRFKKSLNNLRQNYYGELSDLKIANELNLPVEKVRKYTNIIYAFNTLSIDEPIKDGTLMIDVIPDKFNVEENYFNCNPQDEINVLLNTLNDKEKFILIERLDLYNTGRKLSLKELSSIMNVSLQRIEFIEKRAMRKLRVRLKDLESDYSISK